MADWVYACAWNVYDKEITTHIGQYKYTHVSYLFQMVEG